MAKNLSCRWLAMIALGALGCSSGWSGAHSRLALPLAEAAAPARGFVADDASSAAVDKAPMASPAPASGPRPPGDRLLIYTARYELLVANRDDAMVRFLGWVEEVGGYLQSREDGDVTCRIPADRFFPLLERVPSLGRVLRESLSTEDVTRQVVDLDLRLKIAQESRQRLLELLARASETEAILKIEQELRRLNEEIERMQGELKHLRERIAFSTLQVVFRGNAPTVRVPDREQSRFPWINEIGVDRVLEGF